MNSYRSSAETGTPRLWLLTTITVILVGWALSATATFMVPLVFSIFLALLIAPIDRWVADRVPEKLSWLGHVAAMGTFLATLLIFVGLLWVAAQQVVERFPDSGDPGALLPQPTGGTSGGILSSALLGSDGGTGQRNADTTGTGPSAGAPDGQAPDGQQTDGQPPEGQAANGQGSTSNGLLSRARDLFSGAGGSLAQRVVSYASTFATDILSAAGAILGALTLMFFLTLIMLIEAPTWRKKLMTVFDGSATEKSFNSVNTIAARLRRYLLARTIIGAITGALYAAWLWIFGVDLLLVWGLLAFLLNFIPTFGSLIAGILPVVYAFIQKDFGTAMFIGVGILVIEQVMGNYVDPRVQGRQMALSALVVLVALLIWTWIWGAAGAILAVPITIAVMIIFAHIPVLRPVALLLSNATDMEELDQQTGLARR